MIKAIIFDFYGVMNEEMRPNRQLIEFIKNELKPKYKLGLLSNAADEFMYEIIPKSDVQHLFDNILISYQVGLAKPDLGIYKMALDNLSVKPAEAVFIDDLSKHTEPAAKMGIKSIVYRSFGQMKVDLEKILAKN